MKEPYPDRPSWLLARRTGIGASEWAAAIGKSKFSRGPAHVVASKLGVESKEFEIDSDPEDLEWGLRHEPTIASAVRDHTGRRVVLADEHALYRADDKQHLIATPDAFQRRAPWETHLPDSTGTLQIKTANAFLISEWRKKGPPDDYLAQVQAEMRVCNLEWGSLVVLFGGNRLVGPIDFVRRDRFIAAAERTLDEVWQYVLRRELPPFESTDIAADVLASIKPERVGSIIQLDSSFELIVDKWRKAREIRLAAEKQERALKAELAKAIGEHSAGVLPSGRVVSYRTIYRDGYTVDPSSYRKMELED